MDFVWFYAKKFSAWTLGHNFYELDYSIRSVRKNYQGDVRCFVVGDDPGLDVIHVKAPPLVERDEVTGQPRQKDHINKYDALLDCDEINEEFVLIWDDVFILQPTTEEEIKTIYGRCEVENPYEYIKTRSGGTPYKRLWLDTYTYILPFRRQKGLKTYDWETHLPRFMEKKKLKELIDSHFMRDIPKLVTGMYQAFYSGDCEIMPEGLQSDIFTHKAGMDFDKEFECKYMNIGDGVIVPDFVERMQERFGK